MRLGWTELIVILVIVLVIFGGSKLTGVGAALGKSIKEFKKEVKDGDVEKDQDRPKEDSEI